MLKINNIYNNDCIGYKGMRLIDDESIDLIVSDLPYGKTRNKWDSIIPLKPLWDQYKRIIKPNGVIALTATFEFAVKLFNTAEVPFRYDIIWRKNKSTGFLNAKKMPLRAHELILIFYKKLPKYYPQKTTGHPRKVSKAEHKVNCIMTPNYNEHQLTTYDSTERYPTSVWDIPVMNNDDPDRFHSTQKPIELYERIIKTYSDEGDLVLDNASGSGVCAKACIKTNRNYICFETNKDYWERSTREAEELKRIIK